jgi:hypothetical protein
VGDEKGFVWREDEVEVDQLISNQEIPENGVMMKLTDEIARVMDVLAMKEELYGMCNGSNNFQSHGTL